MMRSSDLKLQGRKQLPHIRPQRQLGQLGQLDQILGASKVRNSPLLSDPKNKNVTRKKRP